MPTIRRNTSNILEKDFLLTGNPFASSNIYNVDAPPPYAREIYGHHLDEFFEKFFLTPLESDRNRQVIGALWSSHAADEWGKGFGKSMLMAEESKAINRDLGTTMLLEHGVCEEDVGDVPVLAGYCSFDQSKGVLTFPAALLEAVSFISNSPYHCPGAETDPDDAPWTVHLELRARIIARHGVPAGYESAAIQRLLNDELHKYQGLNIQFTHHTLAAYIRDLAYDDTPALINTLRNAVGPRIRASQGFNFVHVFNAFARLAGVEYIAYFIDQVENFARFTNNQERDIRIVREAIRQTSPTAEMASFIFQMHVHALQEIERWWTIEDMPSLSIHNPLNRARIVDLDGLGAAEARVLVQRYLDTARVPGANPPDPLHPFSADIVEMVRSSTRGNPRDILDQCGDILRSALLEHRRKVDLTFVEWLLNSDAAPEVPLDEDDEDLDNPVR